MVALQNLPVGGQRPLLPTNSFSNSPKQGWVPLLVSFKFYSTMDGYHTYYPRKKLFRNYYIESLKTEIQTEALTIDS